MMKQNLVVVGNGMAGVACVEAIIARDRERYAVTVIGAEPRTNYNRIRLSEVLAGTALAEEIVLNPPSWYGDSGIVLHAGDPAVAVTRTAKRVTTASGADFAYDRLLLATGSTPFIPPIAGIDREGVFSYRTLDDVERIRAHARTASRAMVIGGGLLGLELARALAQLGLSVTVAHLVDHLMEMQCDKDAGEIVKRQLERMGIQVLLSHAAEEVLGNGAVEGVRFANGKAYEANLVVVSAGIRTNVALARDAGLAVKRGVVVNDFMETSDETILAVGECIEYRGQTFGLVAPVMEQARVAAATLLGDRTRPYRASLAPAKLKVAGIDLVSMGNFMGDGVGCETILYADQAASLYQKAVVQGGRVVGAILLGDLRPKERLLTLMRSGEDVTLIRRKLLGDEPVPAVSVANLPDEATVCGCMGVSKGAIVAAIQTHGCSSREAVAEKTRACTSCRSCGPLVDQILQDVLGGAYVRVERPQVFCACVPIPRSELRKTVRELRLRSVSAVLGALGNAVGCPTCRPALAYLVSEVWQNDHIEERRHRFINDRVHANIQKDGSFSVVPRMVAGLTTPEELRRIATVAEKHRVPLVKLTGGARIDLLGVDKAALPQIWEDLGMPSGHAYAKAIRTCKACVGERFCRFGVADSLAMAADLEQSFAGLHTPHKVKLGVSGCPRNCAEATVKDIGLVALQGGWEVNVGGAAGMAVRRGDVLATVATREAALDVAARFLQYYREEANYGERTHAFVERVGIDAIREAVLDERNGVALVERLRVTRARARDPWEERNAPAHPRQFARLEVVSGTGTGAGTEAGTGDVE